MWAYVILLGILVVLYVLGMRYQDDYINKLEDKKRSLTFLYPSIGFWVRKLGLFQSESTKRRIEVYQLLNPGRDARKAYCLELYHKFSILYAILFITSVLGIAVQASNHSTNLKNLQIQRPATGLGIKEQTIDVILKENEKKVEESFTYSIRPRKYTDKEVRQFKKEAEDYVLERMKGDNESLNHVQSSLNLLVNIPSNPVKVSWNLGGQDLIMEDGTLNNKNLTEKTFVTIQASFSYEEQEEYKEIPIGIMPYSWSWEEQAKEGFLKMLKQLDERNKEEETYTLPSRTEGYSIEYRMPEKENAKKFFFCGGLGCVVTWIYWDEKTKKSRKKRDEECQLAYPNIVYKLTLLLGAGMTLRGAWQRIIQDYLKEKKGSPEKVRYVYEEMIITWNEMENGIPEIEAFAQFGKRMKLRPYLRFSSLITQNLKKGTKGFLLQLEAEAKEAQEERKQLARRLGEEAGTKLLFPMLIMLVIVLVIVMLPAFLSFSKGGL